MTTNEKHTETDKPTGTGGFNPLPWVAGVVLVLGLAILAGIYWQHTMTVKRVSFSGHYFVTEQELQEKVTIPAGVKPDSLDLVGLMKKVEEIPYVERADIEVEPGGNLTIAVTERKPMALLAHGEHKIYVDKDGIRLQLLLGKTVDVPILYGFKTQPMSDTLKGKAFETTRDFLVQMQQQQVSNATISEVAWTREQGVVALTNENGVKLVFGNNDFKTRLRNWEAFYGDIIKTKGIASMRTIDLRFRGQVVTQES